MNPKDIEGMKKPPLHLIPGVAMVQMAMALGYGAKRYGPFNWRDESISVMQYTGAAMRHLKAWEDGEEIDQDSGLPHLSHVLAGIAILIDARESNCANDNRPKAGRTAEMIRENTVKPQCDAVDTTHWGEA